MDQEGVEPAEVHETADVDRSWSDPSVFDESEHAFVSAHIDAITGTRRSASMLAAAEATALTQLVVVARARAERRRGEGRSADLPMRELSAEVGAALRVSDRVAQRLLSEALTLTTAFPKTFEALSQGRISPSHERVIVDAGMSISDDEARADYEAKVLRIAEVESAGRLRSMAQVIAARANPESIDSRHRRARRDRYVRVIDADDGMAELRIYQPAALVYGIHDRLTQMARISQEEEAAAAKAAAGNDGVLAGMADMADATPAGSLSGDGADGMMSGDGFDAQSDSTPPADVITEPARSMDQLRADLLADLLLTGMPTGHGDGLQEIRGYVQITVPVLTLIDQSDESDDSDEPDEPAILADYGPIDVDTARCLTATAPGWDRVLTSPFTGEVLGVDRYTPSAQLRRYLRVRDQHCRFPHCRMPFWRDDLDHTVDAAMGGATHHDNLANLCRHHHVVKHKTDWRVRQRGGGRLEWTSPTGRTYVDVPERTLIFTSGDDPPPF